jgi:predicted kinase
MNEATDKQLQMIVLCGLQASGKSTFYRSFFAQTYVLVSKDLFPNARQRGSRQQQLIEEAFQAGKLVVVDNTNVSRAERAELIGLAQRYDAEAICYYFPPDIQQNLERNRARIGKARVPDIAIFAARKRLEVPIKSEGFACIYEVSIEENQQFSVRLADQEPEAN